MPETLSRQVNDHGRVSGTHRVEDVVITPNGIHRALLGLPKSIPDQSYADPHCGADSKRDSRSRGHEHQLA